MKKAVTEDFELRSGGFLNSGWLRRVKKTGFRPPHPAGTQIFPPSGENGLMGLYQRRCRVKKAEFRPSHPAGTQIFPPSGGNGLKGAVPEAVPGEKDRISSATPGGHADVSDHRWAKVHRQLND
jgi:hypothetical protein